jgi:hypothetical protein
MGSSWLNEPGGIFRDRDFKMGVIKVLGVLKGNPSFGYFGDVGGSRGSGSYSLNLIQKSVYPVPYLHHRHHLNLYLLSNIPYQGGGNYRAFMI